MIEILNNNFNIRCHKHFFVLLLQHFFQKHHSTWLVYYPVCFYCLNFYCISFGVAKHVVAIKLRTKFLKTISQRNIFNLNWFIFLPIIRLIAHWIFEKVFVNIWTGRGCGAYNIWITNYPIKINCLFVHHLNSFKWCLVKIWHKWFIINQFTKNVFENCDTSVINFGHVF